MLSATRKQAHRSSVAVTKSISFRCTAPQELISLFEEFRLMCNDAIRIAIKENPKNRFKLIELAYEKLKGYGLHTHYVLSACEVAFSVCKSERRRSTPYIRNAFLKIENQSYQLNHLLLRIPTSPGKFVFLTLQGSNYHLSIIEDPNLKMGSLTITPTSVVFAVTKKVNTLEPSGYLGTDVNERNATVSAADGWYQQFRELGEVVEIKEAYRETRLKIVGVMKRDKRIGKELFDKYSKRERNRTNSRLNKVTKQIANYAKEHKLGIKLENLNGIRRLYRKGNGQSRSFRGRMNSWVFGETQRQIDYKARWDGVPVWYVNPRGTSRNCPDCGSRVSPLADRKVYCPKCDKTWDRDDLASKNIMACAVPQARPSRGSGDGEPRKQEDAGNPRSRWREGKPDG